MEATIKRVDNGWVVQFTIWDILTKKPEVSVFVYPTLEEVLEKVKSV